MSDFDRAAFEEWFKADGHPEPWKFSRRGGAYYVRATEAAWKGWQARASRPVVVTDEMALQGAWAPLNEFAKRLGLREFDPHMAPDSNDIVRARLIISAALNAGK